MNHNIKTILGTGIGGLTLQPITGIIRENHPDYAFVQPEGEIVE